MAKARLNLAIPGLSTLLILTVIPKATGGRPTPYVDYGALNHDVILGSKQNNHHGNTANKYSRGCEPQFHCRGKKRIDLLMMGAC
uniref:Uncharacterized protein n=1 Tax=Oryza brachyantha TaxID=4533 RepID=J3MJM4_ORYBR